MEELPSLRSENGDTGLRGLLTTLGPRTRTLALLLLVVDSIFGASIFAAGVVSELSSTEFTVAVVALVALLLASMIAITIVELTVERNTHQSTSLKRSGKTPSSEVMDALVNSTLEMICRATSLPLAPDHARVRAFIFKVEGDELVCRYYWALNPTSEKVGVTRFPLTKAAASEVAVVKCALGGRITRTPVKRLPPSIGPAAGTVEEDLTFVLAAPILDAKKQVWGTIDFDTSDALGRERLSTPLADAAIFQLAHHLQVMLSLNPRIAAGTAG